MGMKHEPSLDMRSLISQPVRQTDIKMYSQSADKQVMFDRHWNQSSRYFLLLYDNISPIIIFSRFIVVALECVCLTRI